MKVLCRARWVQFALFVCTCCARISIFHFLDRSSASAAEALRRSAEVHASRPAPGANQLSHADAPDDLCCPITLALMREPVQTLLGHTYEREAIEGWLKTHRTDPMTGEPLLVTAVFPNADIKERCRLFRENSVLHGEAAASTPRGRSG